MTDDGGLTTEALAQGSGVHGAEPPPGYGVSPQMPPYALIGGAGSRRDAPVGCLPTGEGGISTNSPLPFIRGAGGGASLPGCGVSPQIHSPFFIREGAGL